LFFLSTLHDPIVIIGKRLKRSLKKNIYLYLLLSSAWRHQTNTIRLTIRPSESKKVEE